MFTSKKHSEMAQAIHTLLGKGTLWKGEIQAGQNSLRIEGIVEGRIVSEGEVTVAPTGEVNGTIEAKHLIVTGRIKGIFRIMECMEIHGTGYVEGEVEVGSLVVDEGGTLQGTCTRRGVERSEPEKPAEKPERLEKADGKPEKAEKDQPFVPFPAPPTMPPLGGLPQPSYAAGAAARVAEDAPSDRHVFNMANGLSNGSNPNLPPGGDHPYSKAKL